MIGIKLDGRLGNQLFQFAFIYTTAKKLGTVFYIDKLPHRIQLYKYFQLKGFGWINHFFYYLVGISLKYVGIIKNTSSITHKNYSLYKGFFQSESFFIDCKDDIQSLFQIKKKYTLQFNSRYNDLLAQKKIIVIHIRRTDYLTHGKKEVGGLNVALPNSFYENAIKAIKDFDSYQLIVIGDDLSFARHLFGNFSNVMFEENSLIIDFQLMLNADALIISNSTFAWWAAWLNNKKAPVYVPEYWMGFKVKKEYPEKIICKNWNIVSF